MVRVSVSVHPFNPSVLPTEFAFFAGCKCPRAARSTIHIWMFNQTQSEKFEAVFSSTTRVRLLFMYAVRQPEVCVHT